MGGFTSIVPMAASALQTGQQIQANQASTQSRIAMLDADRKAELAEIDANQKQKDADREDALRRRQATLRARQGASGLMAGGSGSANAVLAGYEKAARDDQQADASEASRKRNQINASASWREKSLLRTAQDDTTARLSAWFARRDGLGG
ncbi:hypothetical protein [Thalassospira povalilytica]|uniref:hypothetical protein n=1 Tax=Thalassospira povalilytica TaxID=732237 RepID=UPI001D195A19|nr:hypothetical protein [Thalassospira povalilytica]MCC4238746.1 hypothetical protein [Thalassospira povalilytica]